MDSAFHPLDYLSDAGKGVFEAAETGCPQPADRNVSWENSLKKMPGDLIAKTVEEYPNLRFAQPVFVGAGLLDTTVLPEDQYGIVEAACRVGSTVETHY